MSEWIDVIWTQARAFWWNAELLAATFGVLTWVISGFVIHTVQTRRSRVLPMLPSHEDALEGEADDATRFFAAVHDLTMVVTEAWNASRARTTGGQVEELIRRDVIVPLSSRILEAAAGLRERLEDYARAAEETFYAASAVDGLWTYDSEDQYRTETYTVTSTDSKGRTRTSVRTRRVYSHTDHYFTFHYNDLEEAKDEVRGWRDRWSDTSWAELHHSRRTLDLQRLAEGDRMFLERLIKLTVLEDEAAEVSPEDMEAITSQWITGTTIDDHLTEFVDQVAAVKAHTEELFDVVSQSRPSYHFQTGTRSHPGPDGYQAAQKLEHWLNRAARRWEDVDDMISTCVHSAGQLRQWAENNETVESDTDYAQEAIKAYKKAFPESSLEVDQLPRTSWTVLGGFAIGLVVAGIVYVVHPYGLQSW